ncbi:BadF/BadG/BcrA/BcrD ATPase family protein [Cochlodiniinecator piscidefendens]|uniref:BadF/BadG/BcrA/BcrD ATPase family protein n=1 Tax=Cochlodiniinecator piscidefendens TaxID=2715756 RepID=UPI001409C529|nr:BadF/BadG/BcrA/BcrD ATPase family protein [Cochlodiniinecator piscidefendens]
MADTEIDMVLGVDGGGTSCRFTLLCGATRYDVILGSANVHSDYQGAMAVLENGLSELAAKAGVAVERVKSTLAYVGLAGVLCPNIAAQVSRELGLKNAFVGDDRKTAVVGALGPHDGVVVSIGTGSFAARQVAGGVQLMGGYGLRHGDEASGAWLGLRIQSQALHAVDGLVPMTPLLQEVLSQYKSPAALIVEGAEMSPGELAGLAPRIIRAAQEGDSAALACMDAGAAYIERALMALRWQSDEPICLLGGVARHYAPYLNQSVVAAITDPKGTALDGALALAMQRPKVKQVIQ